MNPPDLLVFFPLPSPAQTELEARYVCHDGRSAAARAAAVQAHGNRIRAAVGHGGTQVDAALLERLPALEIVVINGVGYDGVDLEACRARGVRVTNTPDVLTDDVADTAVALVLMTSRRLIAANRFLHAGAWQQGPFPLAQALAGKTAGIVGLGRIGKAVARRLEALGMKVAYFGRQRQEVPYPWFASLTELATAADFLVLCCPGGPATHHLVNDAVLEALGPQGIVINVARGSVVDQASMVRRLKAGQLRAVGLDVFENEPHVPEELLNHPEAVLLPHLASATVETRGAMARLCLSNLAAHFQGQPLLTAVV